MATDKHPLQTVLENSDYADRVRSYSGRGMYGKECLGVTVSSLGDLFADVLIAARESFNGYDDEPMFDEVGEAFRSMRTDNMGHDTIVYFPGVPFVEGDDEEGDEDGEDEEDCD